MTKTVVGSFDSYREAQQVVQELQRAGIPSADVSIVASNVRGEYSGTGSTATGYTGTSATGTGYTAGS